MPKLLHHRLRRAAVALMVAAAPLAAPAAEPADDPAGSFAGLARWRDDNRRLGAPVAGEQRVVFFGDSITEAWALPAPPAGSARRYVNRGIGGQTTPQMLLRFRADVLSLGPRAVVLLAGTNDIAGNTGPASVDQIAGHLRSMAQLARAEGVRVVLCSLVPAARYPWRPELQPAARIVELNQRLAALARELDLGWVDYHAAMADERGGLPPALADDGVHPNAAGYAVMARVLRPELDRVLGR